MIITNTILIKHLFILPIIILSLLHIVRVDTERKLDGIYREESQIHGSTGVIPAQVEHCVAWRNKT